MKRMRSPFCRRMIRGGMALVLLAGVLAIVGCDGDDDEGGGGNFADATSADLANQSFTFTDGGAVDDSSGNQAVSLTFGSFDASNTAPFQVQSGGASASGTATLQSPLTLTFLIIEAGLPFTVNQQITLDARIDSDGRLEVSNTQTGATSTSDPATASATPPVVLLASLSGSQEVPGVTTTGSGSAAVTFNADRTQIAYTLAYTGLTDVTQAHIHAGEAGENEPIIFFLCTNLGNAPQGVPTPQACPAPDGMVTGTLNADDFIAVEGTATFAEAVDALLSGNTYVNAHTETSPSGEIRGQIGAAELPATLSGTQEVPPVESPGSGSATLSLNATQTVLTYTLAYEEVVDVTQAHIHAGEAGENGPIIFFLCTNLDDPQGVPTPQACPAPDGTVTGTLTADDLLPNEEADITTFAEAVNALLSGDTYVNVHSTSFPAGEIRGKVRPRVIEFADAAVFFEFNATDLDLGLQLFFDGEGWRATEVSGPDGTIFEVSNGGSLQEIGSTEVATEGEEPELTESEEPTDEEIDAAIDAFLARFPAGEYEFTGETVDGNRLEGTAILTHNLPAAPQLIFPDPEADDNIADPAATVITWADGSEDGDPAIVRYQAVVTFEEAGTEQVFEFVADVRADPEAETQSVTVPPEFFAGLAGREGEYKAEILAIEASGNKTISEQDFELEVAEPVVVAALAVTRQAVVEFADAAIFFEFNATDLDLGLQLFFDAEGWQSVEVNSPDGGTLFQVMNDGSLQEIGSTEVATEGEEPGLTESEDPTDEEIDDAIDAFLARFPAGEYAFAGVTIEGEPLEGTAALTHDLPAAPQLVFPDPETDENIADPAAGTVVITWADGSEGGDPAIVRYQVVVEFEEEETERVFEVSVDVPADPAAATQSVTIPPEFFASLSGLEGEYKTEVLAVEASGNRTISEHEFEVFEMEE